MENVFLICDDDQVNNVLLKTMLRRIDKNCIVLEENLGIDCIQTYIDLVKSKYEPKAIFLDYNMPKMTGEETAHVLRHEQSNMPVPAYQGPLFCVTSEANPDRLNPRGNFSRVIPKPLTMFAIRDCLGLHEDVVEFPDLET
jgi:CheY-like chemotaxis protein